MSQALRSNTDNTEDDSTAKAKQTVSQLLYNIESDDHSFESLHKPIFLADVESDVMNFGVQFRFCLSHDFVFPCLILNYGDPIPIDWTFGASIPANVSHETLHCFFDSPAWMEKTTYLGDDFPGKIEHVETSRVKNYFSKRLTKFLTSRFNSAKTKSNTTVGLTFKVKTSSKGLRVHYSPAYLFNPNRVFGSPTSPVTSTIQPGRYIFGVAGSGLSAPRFSDAEFDIPPDTQADLMEL